MQSSLFRSVLLSTTSLLCLVVMMQVSAADEAPLFARWPNGGGQPSTEYNSGKPWTNRSYAQDELRRRLVRVGFDRTVVLALGAVGDKDDVYLIKASEATGLAKLQERLTEASSITFEAKRMIESTLWATARLGDKDALRTVAGRLSPPDPREISFVRADRWKTYESEMRMAAYIGDRSLLPAIYLSLVSTNKAPPMGCFLFFPPPKTAVAALKIMIPDVEQPQNSDDPASWIAWFQEKHLAPE